LHGVWAGSFWRPAAGKRGAYLHAALVERPCCRIRRLAGSRAREMQFTRFLRNDAVTPEEMAAHAGEATARRVAGRDIIVIQDTSELALGGRRARANGYGPVGKGGALGGLLLHAVVAVEAGTGALLGLVDFKVWNRTGGKVTSRRLRATAHKESQCWIDGAARAGEVLAGARSITAAAATSMSTSRGGHPASIRSSVPARIAKSSRTRRTRKSARTCSRSSTAKQSRAALS
jgi:hypothetical protein